MLQKDEILDRLARRGNVAQFVAFRPEAGRPARSYSRIAGQKPNSITHDALDAIRTLLEHSAENSVNVRSYLPADPRSREFIYGLTEAVEAYEAVKRLTGEGLHTIVNETIDIHDGGISGVLHGDTLEFSPDDTPRCVEKDGVVAQTWEDGAQLLTTVYGFQPDIEAKPGRRTEFSQHQQPKGWMQTRTILWEQEDGAPGSEAPAVVWPNNFSRMIGDKAFGLLIALQCGVPVPRTVVISRRIPPFSFGKSSKGLGVWTRTCPKEAQPGLYTTVKGWIDPFELLAREDPDGGSIASIMSQDAIGAAYSGAALTASDGSLVVEGVQGEGDRFMLGETAAISLPETIRDAVVELEGKLRAKLGPVRFEWVYDGEKAWCVQLHRGKSISSSTTIVPGEAEEWVAFDVTSGLPVLREVLSSLGERQGIEVRGNVGVTSHVADVLRKAGRPARLSEKN